MFEKAARLKLRFATAKGVLTVEDLWDLPLTSTRNGANLNDIAKGLYQDLKNADEVDFVNTPTKKNEELQLKFDVVKYIIDTRKTENETERAAADKKAKKARLLELIAHKQDQELEGKSVEELTAMVNSI